MEIQKAELSEDQDCFYNDPDINQMRIQVRSQVCRSRRTYDINFQVVDIAPYHGRGQELLEDLKKFSPDFLMLGWCESSYSDVTLLLRREGFFSNMVLRHDLQIITGNPRARPNNIQMEIIKEIGNFIFCLPIEWGKKAI